MKLYSDIKVEGQNIFVRVELQQKDGKRQIEVLQFKCKDSELISAKNGLRLFCILIALDWVQDKVEDGEMCIYVTKYIYTWLNIRRTVQVPTRYVNAVAKVQQGINKLPCKVAIECVAAFPRWEYRWREKVTKDEEDKGITRGVNTFLELELD